MNPRLNKSQKHAVQWHGVPENLFEGKDWFNDSYHTNAIGFLIREKKLSVAEAFEILDNLNKYQAHSIVQGLSREEVLGLTEKQIDAIIKFGLSSEEVKLFNTIQLENFLKLRHMGLSLEQIQKCHSLFSREHVTALGYLLTIKTIPLEDALVMLSMLTSVQCTAVCHDLSIQNLLSLHDYQIRTLITAKTFQGLQTPENVMGLSLTQINIVRDLFHWGATTEKVKEHSWLNLAEHQVALLYLMKECFYPFDLAIETIKDLNATALNGIQKGLSRDDVLVLNEFQIKIIIEHATTRNGLNAEFLKNKTWFDSEDHVKAFWWLHVGGLFTIEHAFAELDGFNASQAKQISNGECRDDILGLNRWALTAIERNKYKHQIKNVDLRYKEWFNSDAHVKALTQLLENKHPSITVERVLKKLEKMSCIELKLLAYGQMHGFSCPQILKLTAIQKEILSMINDDHHFDDDDLEENKNVNKIIINANWLDTDEHLEAFKLLCNEMPVHCDKILEILKLATDQNCIKELLEDVRDNKESWKGSMWSSCKNVEELNFFKLRKGVNPSQATQTTSWGSNNLFLNLFSYFSNDKSPEIPQDGCKQSLSRK